MAKLRFSTLLSAACLLSLPAGAAAKPALVSGSGESRAGTFTAGAQGAEYSICGNGTLRAAPGTRIRLFPVSQRLALHAGKRVTTWSVLLGEGRIDVRLAEEAEGSRCAVLVSAPQRVSAIVLSGHTTALTTADGPRIANHGGKVLTSTGDAFRELPESGVRGPVEQGTLLAAPAGVFGRQVFVSLGEPAAVDKLTWRAVQGARGYRIALYRGSDAKPVAVTTSATEMLDTPIASVEPGTYRAEVRAIDAAGLEGHAASATLRVVGADVPGGAYVDERGTIRLAKGQRVRFSHVDGLQMTYGNAGHYVKASGEIGLYRNGPTTVHFRAPGMRETVRARLAPRGLRAQVFAGPKRAVWPNDPIQLVIKVGHLPDWIEAHPQVTLGIEPLDVNWTRRGNELVATVPPQDVPGPWVVRVDVQDQFGLPLGRDFVEIVAEKKRPPPPRSDKLSAR